MSRLYEYEKKKKNFDRFLLLLLNLRKDKKNSFLLRKRWNVIQKKFFFLKFEAKMKSVFRAGFLQ